MFTLSSGPKRRRKRPDEFKFRKYKPLAGQSVFDFANPKKQKPARWRRPDMKIRRWKPLSGQMEINFDGDEGSQIHMGRRRKAVPR